ncbi:SDR family NAD(P)-dependent oxidoreductase, partial [Nonomuraea basaltis]|uniref:SDR family NAD(P)-dependent oxidoreductase n=1 Tax=Nonomuraea basaltis TaxID=2495887 RepID=UPI00110C7097
LPPARTAPIAGPGSYVITGGYGRLGRTAARWLAERGATRIVLNGRTPAPADGIAQVVAGDLAAPRTAERLVAAATEGGVRLRGVIHAAGVLDDRLIADLDPGSLERVWAAKVTGGLRLHEATRDLELDWWVAFSSAAGLLGSPGQAAYAAANAWLDALCERRRAEGLPAISINWGPWAGTDAPPMPAVEPLTAEEGLEALEALIQRDLSAGVVKLNPAQAITIFPAISRMPYFSEITDIPVAVAQDLADLPPEEALTVVSGKVRERAAAVLGVDAGRLGDDTVLTDLGLDSLAATRLRGTVEHDFGVTVPTTALLRGATLGTLARTVAEDLGLATSDRPAAETVSNAAPEPSTMIGPRDAAERQAVRVLTGLLGREPSVTEPIDPGVLFTALDLLSPGLRTPPSPTVPMEGTQQSGAQHGDTPRTAAEIADVIRRADEAEADRGIVRSLTTSGRTGKPIFLAHPAGGTTGVYTLLTERLPVPVFGLERVNDPLDDIPGRAARYAQAIRDTCAGPYRLGGWSFGGILAFEIAQRLGEGEVELVAMIDAGLPEQVPEAARREIHVRRYVDFSAYLRKTYGADIHLGLAELRGLDEQAQLALTEARIAESGVLDRLSPAILRHQLTSHEDTRAIERYRPRHPHRGRVVLYRSTDPTPWTVEDPRYAHENDPARGFAPYCTNLEIVEIPGSHHLNLLDPPHVEVIAEHLKGLI